MPRAFVLPDLGEGLTEAEIVKVLVKEGDVVGEDAPLLEVETDKAQVEIPSPLSGRVLTIHVEPHQTVKVGAVLVTFADAEESTSPAVHETRGHAGHSRLAGSSRDHTARGGRTTSGAGTRRPRHEASGP